MVCGGERCMKTFQVWIKNRFYGTNRKRCANVKANSRTNALVSAYLVNRPNESELLEVFESLTRGVAYAPKK